MKLINYTLLYLSVILFIVVSFWAVLFYFQVLNQVKTTIDESLADQKIVIIDKLKDDSLLIQQNIFLENSYITKGVSEDYALQVRDTYKDTLIYSYIKNIKYRTRMLTTAFAATDGKYYEMKVISQKLDRGNLLRKLATSLLLLYLFLFVSIILLNNFVLKKTWQPFYQLLEYTKDFQLDKGSMSEPAETKIKEFSILNKSILKLLKANVNIYNRQKQFIENASHELQTPLAIGINKLELLAGEKGLSPDQIQKIGNILEIFQRLTGLNKYLLLLSKIENNQFPDVEQFNFDELFKRLVNDFSDYAEYREIRIKYINEGPWSFKMNKNLAEFLTMNLVKNAIVHNRHGGETIIKLSSSHFSIENTSDAPPLPAEKLFDRFNKKPNCKSSTGLGLAIVKAIADVSSLSVTYYYNGSHTFKVSPAPH
jgi:signal transduction histidine kinase